ncbi:MAG: carboxypeptidase regulatory-like domain-containing protein [Bryobacteraceae bacterium]
MSNLKTAFAILLACAACFAQEFRASISGQVTDAQSAAIPGAKVTATNVETGAVHQTVSTVEGQYTIPFLPPGFYRVAATAEGFKQYVREKIRASANERVRLDIPLEVGALSESVTVTAEAPMLESATGSSGQVINTRQIENMPLNGRTPFILAQLAFGVIPDADPKNTRPFDNAAVSDISMGGSPGRSNEMLLDGGPDVQAKGGQVAYNPPVDAVQEVKVETFQADAAYGHTGGGTVNLILKSGTNALHGAAYWYNQQSRFAATPFFTNRAGQKKSDPLYHQYGANAGGPIARDRLFFYFAFEGMKNDRPSPTSTTVPTAEERGGDLSALLKVGNSYQIYDPLTGTREGTRVRRQPFAGNIIPAARISPIAKNYMQYYPAPNQQGQADGQNNYLTPKIEHNSFDNELGRVDYILGEKHKLFANFRHNNRDIRAQNLFDNIATGEQSGRKNWGGMIDDVYTITPTTVLDTRFNWTRFTGYIGQASDGFDMTRLGFPQALAASVTRAMMPMVNVGRFNALGHSKGSNTPGDSFQVFSSVTRVAGRHTLKAGADLRMVRTHSTNFANGSGSYTFGSEWTRGPLDNASSAPLGQDLASFLLGLPTGGTFDVNASASDQGRYYAFFLQDDVRVRRNLTLNLGIRHERDLALTERFNRAVNGFDFGAASPISSAAAAAYARAPIAELPASQFRTMGGLTFAGPNNRALYRTGARYFSPRLGFAWTATPKLVVRGGVGVFFFPLAGSYYQTGFTATTPLVATLDGYLTPNVTLANGFPNGPSKPVGSAAGLATNLGQSVSFYSPDPRNAYSIRWNLSIQREIASNLLVEIGYMGSHSLHMETSQQLNFVPRNYLAQGLVRDQAVINMLTANVTNPFAGLIPGTSLNGSTVQRNQLLKPYPQFSGVTQAGISAGSSYFHMLQARVEKRFSHGIQFMSNFAWSKMMQQLSRLNDSDPFFEKRVADEHRPYRLVTSLSYDLPFARGRELWRRLAGGWTVNAISTQQAGAPLGWGNAIYYGGDLQMNPKNIDAVFDVTRFNRVSSQQLDWNIRTFPSRAGRGDKMNNLDFSVVKNFAVTEKLTAQYRCEAFNALNHPQFGTPSITPTSSAFGRTTSQANLPRSIQMALRLKW